MTAYRTVGTDSSGRPIRMSPVEAEVWERVCDTLGFAPVITQGGWMGTLAAKASGPTHDGDALDLRVWNLTAAQVQATIRNLRVFGFAAWLRNREHGGFADPHIHAVPGRWAHPSPSALRQWDACRNGRDGLASNGPDYHPYPLATTPPEDAMSQYADQLDRIEAKLEHLSAQVSTTNGRLKGTRTQLTNLRKRLMDEGFAPIAADIDRMLAALEVDES